MVWSWRKSVALLVGIPFAVLFILILVLAFNVIPVEESPSGAAFVELPELAWSGERVFSVQPGVILSGSPVEFVGVLHYAGSSFEDEKELQGVLELRHGDEAVQRVDFSETVFPGENEWNVRVPFVLLSSVLPGKYELAARATLNGAAAQTSVLFDVAVLAGGQGE
ncbi:MAG: hypothetical protein HY393_00055 [Candidatus Diapherotrites archaeon]|nr:hypothetical protein [Candidatus Diapherotrites archaeon]